ncbi:MFS transporter [Streptomyces sp. NBC_01217]|uniref:MFS transporter n=1 Tax=Streptomyces sp. NBC_01217 TaxID=2903779 RepID=UPI002E0F680F|nr:MFS transporter [Streptomyces sp. NBC_01217]
MDFYDLYAVVYVAPVIAELFFPSDQGVLSLAGAYVTLAATLLMRPVGAILLGGLADRHGRKRAMVVALLGVGTVTMLLGALPTAGQIGVLAPILLLTLRLVQGFFVGGVFASTLTMATESVRPRWRGLVSGLVGGGATAIGSVLAALSFLAATQLFPGEAFDDWGWRAMFFVGGVPVLLSLIVSRYVHESPSWERTVTTKDERPLRRLVARPHRRVLTLNILLVFGIGTHFLLTLGFLPSYLKLVNGLDAPTVGKLMVAVTAATLLFAPLTGHLSQRFGRRSVLLAVSAVNAIALPFLYWHLADLRATPDLLPIALVAVLVSCGTVSAFGPLPIFLNESFPTAIRGSGVALSTNGGFALAGLVPVAVNGLSDGVDQLPLYAVVALVLASVVTLACLSRITEPGHSLD